MLTRNQLARLRRMETLEPNKIGLAMRIAGLNQKGLAGKLGVSQNAVHKDVKGKYTDLSLTKARTYADLFGCTVDDLFPSEVTA